MSKKHNQKKSDAASADTRGPQPKQDPAAKPGTGDQQGPQAKPADGAEQGAGGGSEAKEALRLAPRSELQPGAGLPGAAGPGKAGGSPKPTGSVTRGDARPGVAVKGSASGGSKDTGVRARDKDEAASDGATPAVSAAVSAKGKSASEEQTGAVPRTQQVPRTPVPPIPVAPPGAGRGSLAQRAAAEASAAAAANDTDADGASGDTGKGGRTSEPVEIENGGGFRSLGMLGMLAGCGLAAGAFVSPEVAGMVDKLGVQPGSVVVAGLVLFGVGVIQRAMGLHRQAEKQLFDSLAGANKRLRRDFHELREVSASLGQNVDVLQEKTESLVQLASGHGFQSSIFSLAASLDHLGITVKERCDALDKSVAIETGKALESQETLAKRMGELQEGLEERQRELQSSLEGLVGRADASAGRLEAGVLQTSQQVLEELGRQRGGLSEALAGLSGELQRSSGAAVAGLRAQIDEVGRALEAGRREGQTQVSKSLERQQASLSSSLTGLAEEVHRATRTAGEELLASVEALRSSLEADRRGGEERVGAELERHREALIEQLKALSGELRCAATESSAAHADQAARVEALESTLVERHESMATTLDEHHRTLVEELGSVATRTDEAVAGVGERVEGGLRTVEQRLAQSMDRKHAELTSLGRETGELVRETGELAREGGEAARQAGEAAREVLAVARAGAEAARGSHEAALEAAAAAREGTEAARQAGAAAREGSEAAHEASATARGCIEAAREASEAAREGTASVEQVTPRLERTLRERLVDLTREQGALAAGTREAFEGTREAVEARVARLEAWLSEQHGSLQGVLESRLEATEAASGQLSERLERDLRGVEQRLGEDLERRQAVLSSELATLSLDVQHAAQDACAKLEGFREEVSGELGQQVAQLVEQLREHGAELESKLEGLGGDGARHEELHARLERELPELMGHLDGFRAELAEAQLEGPRTAELEAVLERLAGRIEAAMQVRTEKLVGELMAAAELNEERTLTLIGLLSGRELEGLEPTAGAAAQQEVPPALPAEGDGLGESTEVDWAAGTERGEGTERRWDGGGDAGW